MALVACLTLAQSACVPAPAPALTRAPTQAPAAVSPTPDTAARIANAVSAAPMTVAKDATIVDWPAQQGGDWGVLRKGTNKLDLLHRLGSLARRRSRLQRSRDGSVVPRSHGEGEEASGNCRAGHCLHVDGWQRPQQCRSDSRDARGARRLGHLLSPRHVGRTGGLRRQAVHHRSRVGTAVHHAGWHALRAPDAVFCKLVSPQERNGSSTSFADLPYT